MQICPVSTVWPSAQSVHFKHNGNRGYINYLSAFLPLGWLTLCCRKTLLCLKERRAVTRNRVFLFRPSWRRMRGKIFGWRCHVLTWRSTVSANVLYQCFITRLDMSSVHPCYRSAAWAKLAAMETIAASLAPFSSFQMRRKYQFLARS